MEKDLSTPDEELKYLAAKKALEFVSDGMAIGLGTGSTITHLINLLGEMLSSGKLRDISVVPTSSRSAQMAAAYRIPIITLAHVTELDLVIDGADEVDPQLNLIKGMGGALLREKIVAMNARKFIVIVDGSKLVHCLGTKSPLPVEIVPFESQVHLRWLSTLGSKAELMLGADQLPVITDNGNYISLCYFNHQDPPGIPDPYRLSAQIKAHTGIVEHGLFLDMTSMVVAATPSGIRILEHQK
jgi:ribose 5-phosphate isomerase A